MSLSLQEYSDYLFRLGTKQQTSKQLKAISKPQVTKIKPKKFTTKKR